MTMQWAWLQAEQCNYGASGYSLHSGDRTQQICCSRCICANSLVYLVNLQSAFNQSSSNCCKWLLKATDTQITKETNTKQLLLNGCEQFSEQKEEDDDVFLQLLLSF